MLALIVGFTGATWGWFLATKAEVAATKSEQKSLEALGEVTKERDAKNDALADKSAALTAEAAQRELAERKLIEGLLRPIGYGDEPNTAELRSFVEWSALPDSRLKLRVLEVAFEDPETALRVARRAERSIQACVGLSLNRRAKVVELASATQRDMTADPGKRVAACWLAMELSSPDLPALAESIDYLNRQTESGFREFVGRAKCRIEADHSPSLCLQLPDLLIDFLRTTGDDDDRVAACTALAAASTAHSTIAAGILIDLAGDDQRSNVGARQDAIREIIAMTPVLKREEISRSADALIGNLNDSSWTEDDEPTEYQILLLANVSGLIALAPHLESSQRNLGWNALIELLEASDEDPVLDVSIKGLDALVTRLEPTTVASHWDELISALRETTDGDSRYAATEGLKALTARLESTHVAQAWETLTSIMEESNDDNVLSDTGDVLVALASRLDTTQSRLAADTLPGLLRGDSTDTIIRRYEGSAFACLAPKLAKKDVQSAWESHVAVLETSTDYYVLESAGSAVAALGGVLDDSDIAAAGTRLIKLIKATDHSGVGDAAWEGFVALAPRLPSEQIIWGCDEILDKLRVKFDLGRSRTAIVTRWHALSPRLEAEQVANYGDRLRSILRTSKDWRVLSVAAKCLNDMAPRFDRQEAAHSADILAVLLTESNDDDVLRAADDALVTLSSQLDSSRCNRIAAAMTESIHISARARAFATMTQLLVPEERDRISNSAMIILFDMLATTSGYFESDDKSPDFRAFRFAAFAMSNPKSVARVFTHSGCVDEPREFLLQRFEELVFHDGKHVFLTMPESDTENAETTGSELGGLTPSRSPFEQPVRRFQTIHDAAAWIQQNWHDFDLEATHPVTWRGER